MNGSADPVQLILQTLKEMREEPYDRESLLQFLGFAAPLARQSRAQLFQDLWALWETQGRMGGYFVEFGACDGVHLSNTYLLERVMGWTGIIAEPHPYFSDMIHRNRSCRVSTKCVWRESGQEIGFLAADNRELARVAEVVPEDGHEAAGSRIGHEVMVQTISLQDLLTEAGAPAHIDFLSIDTEGSEFEILNSFDFEGWSIGAICVEHNGTAMRARIHDLLTAKGYRRKWVELSQFDDWYVPVR